MRSSEQDNQLPQALRALWGQTDPGRRGPKPGMSVRSIAAAAVEIADKHGLEAASMAAVAKQLGFTTMSLYRYFDSKSDLQAVMIDEAAGPAPTPNKRRSWRGQLEDWARADARYLAAHPWVLDVRLGSPPTGPNLLGWMDIGFQILHRSGLAPQQAASSLLVVDGYVRNHVLLGLQYASAASGVWVAQLRSVLDPDELPAVSAMLESGAFDDDDGAEFPGDEFEFGLALLLDGIEQLANRRAK